MEISDKDVYNETFHTVLLETCGRAGRIRAWRWLTTAMWRCKWSLAKYLVRSILHVTLASSTARILWIPRLSRGFTTTMEWKMCSFRLSEILWSFCDLNLWEGGRPESAQEWMIPGSIGRVLSLPGYWHDQVKSRLLLYQREIWWAPCHVSRRHLYPTCWSDKGQQIGK